MNLGTDEPHALQLARAYSDLTKARDKVDTMRRLVAIGEAGASSLSVAEWELDQALRNLDRLKQQSDYQPPDAA